MNITRRALLGTAAGFLAAKLAAEAFAQTDWLSTRLVRLSSRRRGQAGPTISRCAFWPSNWRAAWGQQFIVENKPGAGTRGRQ